MVGPFTDHDRVNVIIETPSGSRTKNAFRANKVLPLGLSFPCDVELVPRTKADDGTSASSGSPSDAPLAMGTVVDCRVLELEPVRRVDRAAALDLVKAART